MKFMLSDSILGKSDISIEALLDAKDIWLPISESDQNALVHIRARAIGIQSSVQHPGNPNTDNAMLVFHVVESNRPIGVKVKLGEFQQYMVVDPAWGNTVEIIITNQSVWDQVLEVQLGTEEAEFETAWSTETYPLRRLRCAYNNTASFAVTSTDPQANVECKVQLFWHGALPDNFMIYQPITNWMHHLVEGLWPCVIYLSSLIELGDAHVQLQNMLQGARANSQKIQYLRVTSEQEAQFEVDFESTTEGSISINGIEVLGINSCHIQCVGGQGKAILTVMPVVVMRAFFIRALGLKVIIQ
eukprot:NODE_4948_length_1091_cov_41.177686_g4396_i0.p1 GENE.NODE_4948_length_1091_cov_41.177686_g4396_i0~~NODE_4948_length_1091_cov_41.177686_g4396_i0.p1  ORF type:complete len:336 (-),score=64.26 NODE_4948_length_1091_cov_41.177686_g4396_i0:82-984(-)